MGGERGLMLPVDAVLPDLLTALEARATAVLVAPPGAGKTTRAPLALLEAPWAAGRKILLLAPRRIAARAAAQRMAATLGERVGETIGFRVRLESKVSARTRIEVMTEGVFTRRILGDPTLGDVAAVLFDEFHERSLEGDLGLALARDAQAGLREDMRIVVMSATLDVARVSALLGDAPVIESKGRMHPVRIEYRPRNPRGDLEADVADAVCAALRAESGSALMFLPGAREIERVAALLRARVHDAGVDVHTLYGALSGVDQDAAIAPAPPGRRKIVLATSIAETSLTIEGVRVVIDSGLARRPRYEPDVGLTRLETVRASQASITQRAGRAGRLEPGLCVRLWAEGETRALAPADRPEILEADLSNLVLDLAAWGVADPAPLSWLDPPPMPAWREARALLNAIGALDDDGRLTAHGRALADLPLPPRLAHMVCAAPPADRRAGAHLAVLLTEQGLGGRDVDVRVRLDRFTREGSQRAGAARGLADRIARMAGAVGDELDVERVGVLLALAFPDRVAKARGGAFLMANGRAAGIDETEALARARFIAVAEIAGRAERARVIAAAPIEQAELETIFADRIETRRIVAFDAASGAVRGRRVRSLGKIALSEGPLDDVSGEESAAALHAAVRAHGIGLLPWSEQDVQLRARVALLRKFDDAAWPDWSDEALMASLDSWLAPALLGASKLADIKIGAALEHGLSFAQRRALAVEAPPRFDTPAGGSAAIDYACEGAPAVDVRLQELFGMAAHPAIANGRAPLLLRLLSPAQRPIQVTRDLPGFWSGSYAAVRAEMRGRYPKHPWPNDPLSAPPTRRAKPRQ